MTGGRGNLALADGTLWSIEAQDSRAAKILSCMMEVMGVGPAKNGAESAPGERLRRVSISFEDNERLTGASDFPRPSAEATTSLEDLFGNDGRYLGPNWATIREEGESKIDCILRPLEGEDLLVLRLIMLSSLIASRAQTHGGLLVHGALAEREGQGIILAGPGGAGKTTASRRFRSPWRSLSDDRSLVVRDVRGNYRAHPWPTWSNLMNGGSGGAWDVQHSVPLRGLFFLSQGQTNKLRPIGNGEALCLLLDCADQTLKLISRDLPPSERRAFHLRRLDNARMLAGAVPSHRIDMNPKGQFWLDIEKTMQPDGK